MFTIKIIPVAPSQTKSNEKPDSNAMFLDSLTLAPPTQFIKQRKVSKRSKKWILLKLKLKLLKRSKDHRSIRKLNPSRPIKGRKPTRPTKSRGSFATNQVPGSSTNQKSEHDDVSEMESSDWLGFVAPLLSSLI